MDVRLEEFKTQVNNKENEKWVCETINLRARERERMSTHVSIIDESCWRGGIFWRKLGYCFLYDEVAAAPLAARGGEGSSAL